MSIFEGRKRTLLSYKRMREHIVKGSEARSFLENLFDPGTFREAYEDMETSDPLNFPGYRKKVKELAGTTDLLDGCVMGYGKIEGIPMFVASLDKDFLMGSMGTVVGEKLTRTIEAATKYELPLVIFSMSGGARMQEGLFSLMQMAKTSAAIERYRESGGFYISILMHPTTGGVSASYANLGDVILAEPNALIGFAGPRVIEQTIGEELPEGFQRSEFQLGHGFVDKIVERKDMRKTIGQLLRLHKRNRS